jgi:hypothetical protein
LGVISNPLSGGNRRGGYDAVRNVLRGAPHIPHREVSGGPDVRAALEDFDRRGVDLVAVNSGDGTVQAVMTALQTRRSGADMPLLALLSGGTTNMTHQDLGLRGPAAGALKRLIGWAQHGEGRAALTARALLRVENPAHPEPLYGFFMGAACIYKGIRFFHSHVRRLGLAGDPAHVMILARFLAALARRDDALVRPVAAAIRMEQRMLAARDFLLILVTTLDRLILGLRPFWRRGPAPLRLTAVGDRPARLGRALPALVFGRAVAEASAANGYFNETARRIELDMDGGFALDGELYTADRRRGPVVLSDGGTAHFVRV